MTESFWTRTENRAGYEKLVEPTVWTLESDLVEFEKPLTVLDIGTDTGDALQLLLNGIQERTKLEEDEVRTFGLDPQKGIYRSLREGNTDYSIKAVGEEIPLKRNSVDYAVSNYIMPFIDSDTQTKMLQEIERVVKPEGMIALHLEPYETVYGETNMTDHYVMTCRDFLEMGKETHEFSDYPLTPERGSNRFYSDNRDDLPSGFYDEFRERIGKLF